MNLAGFLIRRTIYMMMTLVAISILVFLLTRVMPGDPAKLALGNTATKEMVEKLREEMHLNDSLPIQYCKWIAGVFHGDFGRSYYSYRAVIVDVKEFLPATLELVVFAVVVLTVAGIGFGVLAAAFKDRWIDQGIRVFAYAGVSIPYFLWGIFLLLIFGYFLDLLPTGGRLTYGLAAPMRITGFYTIDGALTGNWRVVGDALKHLIMPVVSISVGGLNLAARITRAGMIDNQRADYIQVAQSLNIPRRIIMAKYLLKPSVIPTVSLLGMELGVLVSKAFLVELIFNWPGISRYGIAAMLNKDVNAITAVVLIVGVLYVGMNFVVDVAVGFLDPRTRLQQK